MTNLTGLVKSGEGQAQEFVALPPYRDFFEDKLGYTPFPGTLNIEVDKKQFEQFKQDLPSYKLESFTYEGKNFGSVTIYKAFLGERKVGLLDIERTDHEENIVEIIAAEELRDIDDLEDGDVIELKKEI